MSSRHCHHRRPRKESIPMRRCHRRCPDKEERNKHEQQTRIFIKGSRMIPPARASPRDLTGRHQYDTRLTSSTQERAGQQNEQQKQETAATMSFSTPRSFRTGTAACSITSSPLFEGLRSARSDCVCPSASPPLAWVVTACSTVPVPPRQLQNEKTPYLKIVAIVKLSVKICHCCCVLLL